MALNVAIAGCGGMAGGHLRSYIKIKQTVPEKINIVAMCDPVVANAEKFAAEVEEAFGKKPTVYADIDEMLAKEDLDAIDICAPHGYHHVNAIKCMEAGVNVMVEKPIGVTVKATLAIMEVSERTGKIAATAEQIRRMPSRRASKWLMDKGMIGEMRMFFCQEALWRDHGPEDRWHWRLDLALGGGGMVMDSGAHFCDTVRYLYGDPQTVYARVDRLETRMVTKGDEQVQSSHEDMWAATINFKSGVTGVWSSTLAAPGHEWKHAVHYGSDGCLLDDGDIFHGPFDGAKVILKDGTEYPMSDIVADYKASLSADETEKLFPHGFEDGVLLECYDFVDAVENGRDVEIPAAEGLRSKSICEAIYESGAIGQAVDFDAVLSGEIEVYQKPINEHWGL